MNIERILVATDLSQSAIAAYAYAAGLAQACKAELTLLHVDELVDFGFQHADELNEHLERIAQHRSQVLRDHKAYLEQSGQPVILETASGPPWKEILRVANDRDAQVIVVAKQGARGLERLLLGSTCVRLLRNTDRPVLVVPAPLASEGAMSEGGTNIGKLTPQAFKKLLVTTDFSSHSQSGFQDTVALAGRLGASVTLSHVLRLPTVVPTLPGEAAVVPLGFQSRIEREADEELRKAAQAAGPADVSTQLLVDQGVAEAIAQEAQRSNMDLVIVPSHGKGALRSTLLGSTTESLLNLATRPVLVLPGRTQ